jgi:hypothetical protein
MIDERAQNETPQQDSPAAGGETPPTTASERAVHRQDERHEHKRFDRGGPRRGGPRRGDDRQGRHDHRPGRYRPVGGGFERLEDDPRITALIRETEEKLRDSIQPAQLPDLNAVERKQVHRYFERYKPAFETKTYRGDGEAQVLWVFPVANLTKWTEEQAKRAVETDTEVALPPMSSYERFLVHNALKTIDSIEAVSEGEGAERHIRIQSKKFGRGLKKIIKKIKLM